MKSAPSLPKGNFTAMLRLDHNRALSQLATKTGKPVTSIQKLVVWGNHSPTMYPDIRFATIDGQPAAPMVDPTCVPRDLHPDRRQARRRDHRGTRPVIGRFSANAAIDHVHDWVLGSNGGWVTMGVPSDGGYGVPEEIIYGVPCICAGGRYEVIKGLAIDEFSRGKMDNTLKELLEERDGVSICPAERRPRS